MKTIIHILNTGSFSGAESVVITIINEMRQSYPEEYHFIYLCRKGNISGRLHKENIECVMIDKLSISKIRKIIKAYSPDLIHAHDFTASILASMSTNTIPVISHLHNNVNWIKSWNWKTLAYRISLGGYKKIIAVSDSVIQEFVFRNKIKSKAIVMGNPISIKAIKDKIGKIGTKTYDIAFLGRLSEQKDPIRFIQIIQTLAQKKSELKAVMIGTGELQELCEKQIKAFGLEEQIRMTGFLENPYEVLKEAKILCITSKWEGFGLMAVEGLASQIPIVSTCVGGLKNIIDMNCGTFCYTDEDFISELKRLIDDGTYYNKKKQGTMKRAKKLDNCSSYITRLHNIYNEL